MQMDKAIVACLTEIFPDHGIDLGDMTFDKKAQGGSLNDKDKPPPKQSTPAETAPYKSAIIILLSDGRIYVVSLSTVDGDVAAAEGMYIYLRLDEPTLREVARITGGEYHYAGTAENLRTVYESLGSQLTVQTRETELSGLMALVAALMAVAAVGLSVVWFGRGV